MMQTVASSGGAFAACSTLHINIFGPHAIVVHGTAEQKARMLPPLIRGELRACFGVTEPDAGLDTTHIKTRAVRDGRPLRRARPQGVDLDRAARATRSCCSPAPRRSSNARGRPRACRCSTPTSTAPTSRCTRSARWAAPRSIRTRCSSTRSPFRSRIGSARRARASATSSTASIRSASSTPPRRSASAGARSPKPRPTPTSAWCSAARSGRTRRSSIRWPRAGPSCWRPS